MPIQFNLILSRGINMTFHYRFDIFTAICIFLPLFSHAQETKPLFTMDFSKQEDWKPSETVRLQKDGDTPFLRLQAVEPDKHVMVYRRFYLPTTNRPVALRLTARIRAVAIEHGRQNWNNGHLILKFKDNGDKEIKPVAVDSQFNGTTDWQDIDKVFKVPGNANYLEIMPYLLQAKSGCLDIARLDIFAATKDDLPKPPPIVASSKMPSLDKAPSPLRVNGNKLVDENGQEVWLQGVCIDSLQWTAGGEHILQSLQVAIEQWHANVVRLPVTDEFWGGRGKWQSDKGLKYRSLVDSVIREANSRGAYVVLDLHRFKAPQEEHAEFWHDAATRYANQPGVIFELFNEPHSIGWTEWKTAMQKLLDTVRQTGANNVAIVGGLDWGFDLTGVASGEYVLQDTATGRGIVYSSHIYPWKFQWDKYVLAAAGKHPLFIGEVGNPRRWEDFSFIVESARKETVGVESVWPKDVIGVIQANRLNWTAFSFHPKCAPQLLEDWNYTPTPFWGVHVKEALGGKFFDANTH